MTGSFMSRAARPYLRNCHLRAARAGMLVLVFVLLPAAVRAGTIEVVPGASGAPGETISFSLRLRTMGQTITAAQNDVSFDAANTPIVRLSNDRPDCSVNPAIDKDDTLFGFQPPGCGFGTTCTSVRAVIVSLQNIDPIADDSVLYTCRVAIGADTMAGSYPLTVDGVVLVDAEANELPGAQGAGGSIVVAVSPTATPTPSVTPTPTLVPSSTETPTPFATSTDTPAVPVCAGDCDGDHGVAINELVIAVSIALGALPPDTCPSFAGGDPPVDIADLVAAVNNALSGCGGS